ncbi:hypothetical protein H0H93_000915 [Arthromyces matolae]|nr:hypothetical protein H0H93_000915 [Arthromyces matolae]
MKPLVHHPAQTMMPPSQSSTGSDATDSARKGKRSGSTLSSDRSSPPSHRKRARETPTGDENKSLKLKRMVSTAHPKQMEFGSSLLGESIPPTVTPLKVARQDTIPVPSPRVSESPVYQSSAYEINVHTSTPQSIFKPVAPSKRLSSSGPNNGVRLQPSSCRPTHPPFAPMFSPACATSSPDRTEPRFTSHTLTHRPWSGQMPPQERTPCRIQEISTVSNTTSTSSQTHATIAFRPIRFSPINSNRFPPVLLGATHDAVQLSTEQHLNSGFQRSPLTPLRQHGTSPVSGFEPSTVHLPLQARMKPIIYDKTSRKPSDLSFPTKSSPGIAPQSKIRERRSPPVRIYFIGPEFH